MTAKVITSLEDLPIRLELVGKSVAQLRVGSQFKVRILIVPEVDEDITWTPERPLRLSYRWVDSTGTGVWMDYGRTPLPPFLAARSELPLAVEGVAPDFEGSFELRISLVLELTHWAFDVGIWGWAALPVEIKRAQRWPSELNDTNAGKALRGAFAAANLSRHISAGAGASKRQDNVPAEAPTRPAALVAEAPPQTRNTDEILAFAGKQQSRMAELLSALSSKEQRIRELESQVHDLSRQTADYQSKEQLGAGLAELRTGMRQMLCRQDEIRRDLNQGEAVTEITGSLRHLVQWTSDSEEVMTTLRQLIAWTETTKDLSKLAPIEQGVTQVRELAALLAERAGEQRAAMDVQHELTLLKLDRLLQRQLIDVPKAGLILIRNRFGLLAVQNDDLLAIAYYSSGELPEPGTVAVIEKLLQPGDCFVDAGANIGIYSLIAAHRVGAKGKVIAVEPTPSTIKALRATLAVNGLSEIVDIQECALGDQDGRAMLHLEITSGHNSLLPSSLDDGGTHDVAVRRGDAVVGDRMPALIKVDVEGWELEVLRGFADVLDRSPETSLIVEYSPEHIQRHGMSVDEWLHGLGALKRRVWKVSDADLSLTPDPPIESFGAESFNLFVSRDLPDLLQSMAR
jgi:FkbM family methyltransferase